MVSRQSVALRAAVDGLASRPSGSPSRRLLRDLPVDRVMLAYFGALVLAQVAAIVVDHRLTPERGGAIAVQGAAFAMVALLRMLPMPRQPLLRFLREAYPLLALGWCYAQTAVLSQAIHPGYHDVTVLSWDRWLFGGHPHAWFRERVASGVVSELLHGCYFAYVLMTPTVGLTLYLSGRREQFRVFATSVMTTFALCYLTFVLFPVKGPWYTFARPESVGFFPVIVHRMLEMGASVGAAFPSSHVAASTVIAAMAFRFARRLSYVLIPIAIGIFFGTVYGGFHYGVDAVAGLITGLVLMRIGPWVHDRLSRARPASSIG